MKSPPLIPQVMIIAACLCLLSLVIAAGQVIGYGAYALSMGSIALVVGAKHFE